MNYTGIFLSYKGFVRFVSRYDKEKKRSLQLVLSAPDKCGIRAATLLEFTPKGAIRKINISPFSIERLKRGGHISFNPLISRGDIKRYIVNHKEK